MSAILYIRDGLLELDRLKVLLNEIKAEIIRKEFAKNKIPDAFDPKCINPGVYKVYWKSGGTSVAAIGLLHTGEPWMAPANWASKNACGIATVDRWDIVDRVELIEES